MDPFTDEKIAELAIAAGMDAMEGEDDDGPRMYWEGWDHQLIAFARALRPVPVPVWKRLPGLEDCDAKGRCWWGYPKSGNYACTEWQLKRESDRWGSELAWLPHWALPFPVADAEEVQGNG